MTGNLFEKRVGVAEAVKEQARTLAARRVALATGLFYVPDVCRVSGDTVEFEFIDGLVRLSELVAKRDMRLPKILHRTGRAIAAVHRDAALAAEDSEKEEFSWAGDSGVFIHGDLTTDNVCFDPAADRLVILDWALAPALDESRTLDSAYTDIVWFMSHLCRTPSTKRLSIPSTELLDTFLRGYEEERPGFLARSDFEHTRDLMREEYWAQVVRASKLRRGIRRVAFLAIQRARYIWWFRYSPKLDMAGHLAYVCLQATREGQASYAHVHEIIKGLRARGWDCDLFEPWYSRREKPASVFEKLLAFVWVQLKLGSNVLRYDVVYVRDHPAVLPAVTFAHLMRVPVVLEVNAPYDELGVSYPWTRWLIPALGVFFKIRSRLSDVTVTVTPQLREWIERMVLGARVEQISNGADVGHFSPVKWDSIPRDDAVFIGVLAPWQGVDLLLEAARSEIWPNKLKLVIAGDGLLRDTAVAAANSYPHIEYLGTVQYSKVPSLLSESLVALIPKNLDERSHTGLAPLKLFEAMASGVPVIVTDIPGQSDIVRSTNCGVVVPAGDGESLAAAVRWLDEHRDNAKKMGERGRCAALLNHSWDLKAAETDSLLREVVDSRRSR